MVCTKCLRLGFCRRRIVRVVSDAELAQAAFIEDARVTIGERLRSSPDGVENIDYIANLYRDFRGRVIGPDDDEVFLDTELLEGETAKDWLREFVRERGPRQRAAYVRDEARERFRVVATIIRAAFPDDAMMWGVRAANENRQIKLVR
jgi:hypothetical protein